MTAPKENPQSGGRPPKYATPEAMQEAIDRYFRETSIYSISALSLELGFCDRHAFYAYEKKPEFEHTIKSARARLTAFYEEGMVSNRLNTTGCIFMAKNFGYSDKTEVDQHIDANVKNRIIVEFVEPDSQNAKQ
jgi:DNA-packaging protein gp3